MLGLEKLVEACKNIGRTIKKNTKIGILLAGATIASFNNNCIGEEYKNGKLVVRNIVPDFFSFHPTLVQVVHYPGCIEGYAYPPDLLYVDPPFWDTPNMSKIVSRVEDRELSNDTRPLDSFTNINLEMSLHSQSGDSISVTNLENRLTFKLDPNIRDWTFEPKPITYWERDANDPNICYLVANVRKEIAQNEGIVPLPNLNGTYESQVPYLYAQIRFKDHFVHLNDDNIVDFKDYAIWASNFGRTSITDIDRANPSDIGAWADYDLDDDVDMTDLGIFSDYYLTSRKRHLEDGWILE